MKLAERIADYIIDSNVYEFNDEDISKKDFVKEIEAMLSNNIQEVKKQILENQDFSNKQECTILLAEIDPMEKMEGEIDNRCRMLKNGKFIEQEYFEELGDMVIKPICNYTMFRNFVAEKGSAAFNCDGELRFIIKVTPQGIIEFCADKDGLFKYSNPYVFLSWDELREDVDADLTDVFALDGTAFGYWDFKERGI